MKNSAVCCVLAVAMGALAAQGKDVYVSVDFLDEMGLKAYSPAMTADHIRTLVQKHKQAGVKGLLWRVASLGLAGYPTERMTQIGEFAAIDRTEPVKRANGKEGGLSPLTWLDPVREPRYVPYYETFKGTMAAIDPFAEARRICREEGVELYFWVDLFDEMFGKFLIAHPECLVHTPDGARYPGLRDYANATAVREKLDEIAELYRYKPDGLYLSTSCHSRHLKFTEPNGAFGVLPGATFTAFLAQLKKECAPHGVKLMIGTPLGGTLPFCSPYWSANEKYRIELEWKRWIDEGIADALVFGDYETLWDRLGFWTTKPEPPAEGVAPIDFYAPEYVRYAKGRVKLYLFSGWLDGNASAEMSRCAQYANKHGLDGFFAHESATIETVAGAFEGLRKAHDAMTREDRESDCPSGELKIRDGDTLAFLGDSITEFGQKNPDGYVNLTLRALAAEGVNVVPVKAGRGGHKSNDMLKRLDRDVLSKKPRWMTFSCGVNDVWHFYHGRGVTLEDYKKNVTEIFDKCAASNCTVIVLTATMFESRECHHKDANEKLAPYNAWLREEANRRGLPLADLNALMWKAHEADPEVVLTRDGVHMAASGDRLLARGVLAALGVPESRFAVIEREAWKPVWVLCRFDLKPDADRGDYIAKTKEILKTVRAEAGCREYRLLGDAETDWDAPQCFGGRTLWMLEKWDSISALKAHLATPHMKAFGPTVKPLRSASSFHVLEDVTD